MSRRQPQLRAEPQGGLPGPTAALADACGDERLLVAWPPLREAHLFVCTPRGRRNNRKATAATSAADAATPTAAAATAADATSSGSRGRGDRRAWSTRVSRMNAVPFSRHHVPEGRAAQERRKAAQPDSSGFAVRQGRSRGWQRREKGGVPSQTRRGRRDFAMHPYPVWCRRPCFMARICSRETKAMQYTAQNIQRRV